jgi:acetyl esterase/lipase
MEASPSDLLKLLVPKTPFILKTALAHSLSLTPTASKWDLRTELTIKILRDMLGPDSTPSSITKNQALTTKDPGIKGKVWISKVTFAEADGEDDVRQSMLRAIEEMSTDGETYTTPDARPLEAEWVGYRGGVGDAEPEPKGLDESEKFANLMKETSSKVTVLYFHGGAMYLLDPSTYRPQAGRIAKETGGRVFNVRYRLAPQNPFPAALLDSLMAYLGLLYPPVGSPHPPIPASEIVFGGDSAGGMLCVALLQLLLQFHRSTPNPQVTWQGAKVDIPLPAGLALISPWLDVTRSLPSIENLAKYDYLPTPSQHQKMPPCPAWPSTPPRADLYTDGSALMHPLVSPLMAMDWTKSPPVFFSLGEEMLYDENAVLAQRLYKQGVPVRWRMFEAMPHVFAPMLENLKASGVHHEEYAGFCRGAVEGGGIVGNSDAVMIKVKSLERVDVPFGELTTLTDEQVEEFCKKGKERIEGRFKDSGAEPEAKPML